MKLGNVTRTSAFPASHVGAEVVPGYVLVEKIGKGGSSEVWAAEGPGGFAAALKFIRLPDGVGEVDLRALEILRRVRHPNVLSTFGAFLKDDWLVLAMERADGTLWDQYRKAVASGASGIARDALVEWLTEAARGIDYLNQSRHAHGGREGLGIQHRDIKPRNLLLVGDGVKVGDFGTARWLEETVGGFTGQGFTLEFAPPEFFDGVTSRHSDQYSLAITYCRLRGGRSPFSGSPAALTAGHLLHAPDLSMIGEAERPAVSRALRKDPESRWESCRAFLDALKSDLQNDQVVELSSAMQSPAAKEPTPVTDTARANGVSSPPKPPAPAAAGPAPAASERAEPVPPVPAADAPPISDPTMAVCNSADEEEASVPDVASTTTGEPIAVFSVEEDDHDEVWFPALVDSGQPTAGRLPVRLALAAVSLVIFGGLAVLGGQFGPTRPEGGRPAPLKPEKAIPPPPPARMVAAPISPDPAPVALQEDRPKGSPAADAAADEVPRTETETRPPIPVAPSVVAAAWKPAAALLETAAARFQPAMRKIATIASSMPDARKDEQDTATEAAVDASPTPRPVPASITLQTPEALDVPSGGEVWFPVKVMRGENAEPVEIRFEQVPEGVTLAGTTLPGDRSEAECEARAGRQDAKRSATIRVVASAGSLRAESSVRLTLLPPPSLELRHRGDSHFNRGEYGPAVAAYRESIRLDPSDSSSALGLAKALAASGDESGAISAYDQAFKLDPADAEAYKARGDIYRKKGDRAAAIRDYGEALRLRPHDASLLNKRGLLLVGQGQRYKAIADFDEAIRLNPKEAVFHYNRGWVYDRLGDTIEAIAEYDAAIRLDPKLALAYKARGATYARRGDLARAKSDRDEAARLEGSARPSTSPAPASSASSVIPGPSDRASTTPGRSIPTSSEAGREPKALGAVPGRSGTSTSPATRFGRDLTPRR